MAPYAAADMGAAARPETGTDARAAAPAMWLVISMGHLLARWNLERR
jgi:hypothetical protein